MDEWAALCEPISRFRYRRSLLSLPPCGGGKGKGVPRGNSARMAPPPAPPRKGEGSTERADACRRRTIEGPQSGLAILARYPSDVGSLARVALQHPDPCLRRSDHRSACA